MRRHRKTISIGILTGVLSAAAPAVASAGSLLSGYGGPGQGNQAILGAALLDGPPGGGGGSAGGGPAGGNGPRAGGLGGAARAGRSGSARGSRPSTGRKHAKGASDAAGSQPSAARSELLTRPAADAGAAPAQTLGLTGDDLLYMLLVLGALGFTGAVTRQLARRPRQGG